MRTAAGSGPSSTDGTSAGKEAVQVAEERYGEGEVSEGRLCEFDGRTEALPG